MGLEALHCLDAAAGFFISLGKQLALYRCIHGMICFHHEKSIRDKRSTNKMAVDQINTTFFKLNKFLCTAKCH